ncbi:DnaJ domain-containing protein [Russula aff. rugulosa BPL654]|nr:DnaJ domain-containing protein [Russula aff. rugulosa BPL654]
MASFPDYYAILDIPKNASTEDVRQAYRRESLKTHPDRLFNASTEEKKAATEKFQAVADAYYVLSDPQRRSDYDRLSSSKSSSERTSDPNASSNFFRMFSGMFANSAAGNGPTPAEQPDQRRMQIKSLRPEVERHLPLWTWLGAACGAGLGCKGQERGCRVRGVGHQQKVEILRALALKVLGVAYS